MTLSTANNSESDADLTSRIYGANIIQLAVTLYRTKTITLASAATYYLNAMTQAASHDSIRYNNNNSKLIMRARCAYL